MRLLILTTTCILVLSLHTSCQSYALGSETGQEPILVEYGKTECNTVRSAIQWYLLYGTYPLNEVNLDTGLQRKEKTYRFLHKASYLDAFISALGGLSLSLTRKTIHVQECEPSFSLVKESEMQDRIAEAVRKEKEACEEKIQDIGSEEESEQSDPDLTQEK